MSDPLTRPQLRNILEAIDGESTRGEIEVEIEGRDSAPDDATDMVGTAIDDGLLVEDDTAGAFPTYTLADESEDRGEPEETTDSPAEESGEVDACPNEQDDEDGETATDEAVDALRDVLRFYNNRVDDTIDDHTENGEHPDRPTTAREYFTEVRGWDDATVDELLLGWAPADHSDQLVAYLHERGHDREAILATGAVGESDSGGFYTTFKGRYVLPYYDADGDPAYAIARVTGGDGGGGRDYGGHPADYKAGKYAKLRHTDERVPFDEPIYGLDTLEEGAHVVVAEGIADAITARELGYSVLSPVAKEFKEAHYGPLGDALEEHHIGRMTIVADADGIRNGDAEQLDPDTIGDAVGGALSPVGAGLAGSLRTASKLGDRVDIDIRVAIPPAPADLENDLDEFVNGPWEGDLGAILASAKPADAFDELADVVSDGPAAGYDKFDSDEYEPTVTSGEETTGDIRDVYAALDRLDAQRVADRTIVSEWLEGRSKHRTFAPTWAPADYTGTANYVDDDKWVDTGGRGGYGGPAVMAAIDAGLVRDTECPGAVSGETWWKAVDHLRELGFSIPEYESSDTDEYDDDPREADVVLEPRRAWDAARRVCPADLDTALDVQVASSGDAWTVGGHTVDVVRAVAYTDHDVGVEEPLDGDAYDRAYRRAREAYGAPLPEYVTEADAADRFDVVIAAVRELDFHDLDAWAFDANVTEADAANVTHYVDPDPVDGWRDSASGESVLVFDSGTVWDADTEETIDALRLIALDSGLIDSPTDTLKGDTFTEAYRLARDDYGAPLPRWEVGDPDVEPILPAADELVDEELEDPRGDLDTARERVERLYRSLAHGEGEGEVSVLQVLPSLGKTTSAIKTASRPFDEEGVPTAYLAPRKDLMKQAATKAEKWGATHEHLPVLGGGNIADAAVDEAVGTVREEGQSALRNPWQLLDGVDEELYAEGEGDAEVELDRATCSTAEGEHGDAWALAVHTARALDYTPKDIHTRAEGLFGRELPCQEHGDCEYSAGWDRVADPEAPVDVVIGSYGHAHVESARTYYEHDEHGTTRRRERAVVLDEYPGEAYTEEFGPEFVDHSVWLANALRGDIEDRQDLFSADLWDDDWVRAWIRGEGHKHAAADAVDAADALADLVDAVETARSLLDEYSDLVDDVGLAGVLGDVVDAFSEDTLDAEHATQLAGDVREAADSIQPDTLAWLASWVHEDVADPLDAFDGGEPVRLLPDSVDGDLRELVEAGVEATEEDGDGAGNLLRAAVTALKGGNEGCRELAVFANGAYAHRKAHRLLEGLAAPAGSGDVADVIETQAFAYDTDAEEGARLKNVRVDAGESTGSDTVLLDRDHNGATILSPPARTAGNGEECPVIGLDATARRRLWSLMLGCSVELEDIHDSRAERARFLRDALGLQVVRAANRPRPYEGDPSGKDLGSDVALLQEVANEFTGISLGERNELPTSVGSPACITTKCVRDELEEDERLDDVVSEWSNYGAVTGDNDLGNHRLAALLGSQHYGDHTVEKIAALAGEEVERAGRGGTLEYGSPVADTYLKHMREDQVMQAALRFTRGESGAVVFARTSALRRDLPVVGEAQVVRSWSDTAQRVASAWKAHRGEQFTVSDIVDDVDVSRRQVRRVLNEFASAGYLTKHEDGRANEYDPAATPTAGVVDLPGADPASDPDTGRIDTYYTGNVWVDSENVGGESPIRAAGSTLPAPDDALAAESGPPGS